jgi:hypothetical protein
MFSYSAALQSSQATSGNHFPQFRLILNLLKSSSIMTKISKSDEEKLFEYNGRMRKSPNIHVLHTCMAELLKKGLYPTPIVFRGLISSLAWFKQIDHAKEVYLISIDKYQSSLNKYT